jgi:alkanesulfonate monooxygenase SsuD/methylene tetrahydromethanopterin reductase-like flavin-dependent oxidoreductase (luciferase family)
VGYAVNPNIAIACPFLCDRDEDKARALAAEHQGFFLYGLGHYAFFGNHEPGKTNIWENYKNQPENFSLPEGRTADCVGTPAQIGVRLKEFEDSGIDQVIFLSQAGRIPHEMLSSSIELFGKEALPEVKERDLKRTKEKAALKQRIIEKAMARKRAPEVPNWGPTFIKAAGHH